MFTMESSALQGTESITVKTEPGEDACMTNLSTIAVSVKVEHLLDDVRVKDEPRSDGVCINSEPSSSEVSVKRSQPARAAAELYAGHAVKDELVLGPELVERRPVRHTTTVSNGAIKEQQSCEIVPRGPFLRDCSVRWNRLDMEKLSPTFGVQTGTTSQDELHRRYQAADPKPTDVLTVNIRRFRNYA
ncbi:uncharacterized protein LOC125239143 [Leguminivora glycinivorella]|uniref:uncharacterized protein LOC125239143 n=1 Tax=Leguminivora glycinivorella TaxID=1035111 RepID=UPI00200BD721|nr:uncharacterized protein LOC125239143 [Leguminivora glycinivorella]